MALMKCPLCGGDSRCYASRPSRDGAVRRHRVCKQCGESFTTYEQVVRQAVEQVAAERMLSLLDTAHRLGISKTTAYNQVVAGRIPAWRSGGRIWISEAWVRQALADRERDWTLAADHV